jgi:hypothetical protein
MPLTFKPFDISDGSSDAWSSNFDGSKDNVPLAKPGKAAHAPKEVKVVKVQGGGGRGRGRGRGARGA